MKYFAALLIYRILLVVLLPIIILFFFLRARKNPDYRKRLLERLGFYQKYFKKHGIVIHAASVGEVLALRSFVEKLVVEQPNLAITFTTFTPTGSAQVKKIFGDKVQHCYLPLDTVFSTYLFLRKLKPKAMVIMETELWPNLIAQAKNKAIKLMIVNGRISPVTIKQYQQMSWLFTPCLKKFDTILSQSEDNQIKFIQLGANVESCQVSGNVKYDMTIGDELNTKQQLLANLLPKDKRLWVVASTHLGDEDIALTAFSQLKENDDNTLLIIVPRHPERFSDVKNLSEKYDFATQTRSSNQPVKTSTQVWILDTLGELMALYGLADIVTIGGSFSDIGGHNPLEPAYFQKPIIVGTNMANFLDVQTQLLNNDAVIQLSNNTAECLATAVSKLLENSEKCDELGKKALQVVEKNQGAVDVSLQKLYQLLAVKN